MSDDEDLMHIIWLCAFATDLCSRCSLKPYHGSFRFWVAVVFEGRNVKQMETDFYYAWHLWYARNARLWRQDVIGPEKCKVDAEALLEE